MKLRYLPAIALLFSAYPAPIGAAEAPFIDDFDPYDAAVDPDVDPEGLSDSPGDAWTLVPNATGNEFRNAQIDVNQTPSSVNVSIHTATATIDNLGEGDFEISADLRIESVSSNDGRNGASVGLACLGSGGFSPGYRGEFDILNSGLGMLSITENGATRASAQAPLPIAGQTYRLSMAVARDSPSLLTVVFTISSASGAQTVSYTDDTPRNGQRFGFHDTILTYPGTEAGFDVRFDNLRIEGEPPIPPPTFEFSIDPPSLLIYVVPGQDYVVETLASTPGWEPLVSFTANADVASVELPDLATAPDAIYRIRYGDPSP